MAIDKEQLRKEMAFTDEVLNIIENAGEFTQSDLQGVVQALVKKIMDSSK